MPNLFKMLFLVIGSTICMLLVPNAISKLNISPTSNSFINLQIKYQPILLIVAFVVILVSYKISPVNFKTFFRFGDINASAIKLSIFGIKEGESWLKIGITLTMFITLATSIFMYLGLKQMGANIKDALPFIPLILLFSISNSFSEEMIFRFGVINNTFNSIDVKYIIFFSAILFGLPHFKGAPGGPIGVLMSALLGWVLAKSMLETKGFFWPWLIHFIQDVVIFSSIIAMTVKK